MTAPLPEGTPMMNDLTIDDSYALTRQNLAFAQLDELSPTERRVLRYLPTHLSRPAIARELFVSVNTVNTHVRNIYSKLDAKSRAEAVERARQLRLIAH